MHSDTAPAPNIACYLIINIRCSRVCLSPGKDRCFSCVLEVRTLSRDERGAGLDDCGA